MNDGTRASSSFLTFASSESRTNAEFARSASRSCCLSLTEKRRPNHQPSQPARIGPAMDVPARTSVVSLSPTVTGTRTGLHQPSDFLLGVAERWLLNL